jgi:hypothetical protein
MKPKFNSEATNPVYWFDTAKRLKISANHLLEKLLLESSRTDIQPNELPGYHNAILAFLQSYMMLMAFRLRMN